MDGNNFKSCKAVNINYSSHYGTHPAQLFCNICYHITSENRGLNLI
jgi:hypothetical protein